MASEDQIALKVEFGGGLERLFSNQKSHRISVPAQVSLSPSGASSEPAFDVTEKRPADITYLIHYLRDNLLKERDELFTEDDGTIRSGILVLVNDSDWELEGEGDYQLKADDEIVFISTLHGG